MKYTVLLAALLAFSLSACGKKEEVPAPAPEVVEAVEAPAPAAPEAMTPAEAGAEAGADAGAAAAPAN